MTYEDGDGGGNGGRTDVTQDEPAERRDSLIRAYEELVEQMRMGRRLLPGKVQALDRRIPEGRRGEFDQMPMMLELAKDHSELQKYDIVTMAQMEKGREAQLRKMVPSLGQRLNKARDDGCVSYWLDDLAAEAIGIGGGTRTIADHRQSLAEVWSDWMLRTMRGLLERWCAGSKPLHVVLDKWLERHEVLRTQMPSGLAARDFERLTLSAEAQTVRELRQRAADVSDTPADTLQELADAFMHEPQITLCGREARDAVEAIATSEELWDRKPLLAALESALAELSAWADRDAWTEAVQAQAARLEQEHAWSEHVRKSVEALRAATTQVREMEPDWLELGLDAAAFEPLRQGRDAFELPLAAMLDANGGLDRVWIRARDHGAALRTAAKHLRHLVPPSGVPTLRSVQRWLDGAATHAAAMAPALAGEGEGERLAARLLDTTRADVATRRALATLPPALVEAAEEQRPWKEVEAAAIRAGYGEFGSALAETALTFGRPEPWDRLTWSWGRIETDFQHALAYLASNYPEHEQAVARSLLDALQNPTVASVPPTLLLVFGHRAAGPIRRFVEALRHARAVLASNRTRKALALESDWRDTLRVYNELRAVSVPSAIEHWPELMRAAAKELEAHVEAELVQARRDVAARLAVLSALDVDPKMSQPPVWRIEFPQIVQAPEMLAGDWAAVLVCADTAYDQLRAAAKLYRRMQRDHALALFGVPSGLLSPFAHARSPSPIDERDAAASASLLGLAEACDGLRMVLKAVGYEGADQKLVSQLQLVSAQHLAARLPWADGEQTRNMLHRVLEVNVSKVAERADGDARLPFGVGGDVLAQLSAEVAWLAELVRESPHTALTEDTRLRYRLGAGGGNRWTSIVRAARQVRDGLSKPDAEQLAEGVRTVWRIARRCSPSGLFDSHMPELKPHQDLAQGLLLALHRYGRTGLRAAWCAADERSPSDELASRTLADLESWASPAAMVFECVATAWWFGLAKEQIRPFARHLELLCAARGGA